jgi:hypothetical protein
MLHAPGGASPDSHQGRQTARQPTSPWITSGTNLLSAKCRSVSLIEARGGVGAHTEPYGAGGLSGERVESGRAVSSEGGTCQGCRSRASGRMPGRGRAGGGAESGGGVLLLLLPPLADAAEEVSVEALSAGLMALVSPTVTSGACGAMVLSAPPALSSPRAQAVSITPIANRAAHVCICLQESS